MSTENFSQEMYDLKEELKKKASEMEVFVTISDTAKSQVRAVIAQQDKTDLFLRLYVQSSASGISFGMALDTKRAEDDESCVVDDIEVRIDRISFPYLVGSNVDYVQSADKTGFQITSPNTDLLAQAGSACGGCSGGAGCC